MVPVAAAAAPSLMSTLAPALVGGAFGMMGANMGAASSAKEANKQRVWQEYMATHAREHDVMSLRRAGLNPILAATQGTQAATPSGAMPTVPDFAGSMSGGAQAALATKRLWKELQVMSEQQGNIEQDTKLKVSQEVSTQEQAKQAIAQTQQLRDLSNLLKEQLNTQVQSTARERAEAKLSSLLIPGAEVESEIDDSFMGDVTRRLKRLRDLIPGIGISIGGKGGRGATPAPSPQRRLPGVR